MFEHGYYNTRKEFRISKCEDLELEFMIRDWQFEIRNSQFEFPLGWL